MDTEKKITEISLILPAYNEGENITTVLRDSVDYLNKTNRSWEIIVIDNCSSDNTVKTVLNFAASENRVRIIKHASNLLYSGSCNTGIQNATGKYVAIMDSDGQATAEDLEGFIYKLEKEDVNLVFGWRHDRHDPKARLVISFIFNILGKLWIQFPFHDLNAGFRVFDRKFISVANINYRINMVNPELYVRAKKAGLKMTEIKIQHFERNKGKTSHNFVKIWNIFIQINKYLYSLRKESKTQS